MVDRPKETPSKAIIEADIRSVLIDNPLRNKSTLKAHGPLFARKTNFSLGHLDSTPERYSALVEQRNKVRPGERITLSGDETVTTLDNPYATQSNLFGGTSPLNDGPQPIDAETLESLTQWAKMTHKPVETYNLSPLTEAALGDLVRKMLGQRIEGWSEIRIKDGIKVAELEVLAEMAGWTIAESRVSEDDGGKKHFSLVLQK